MREQYIKHRCNCHSTLIIEKILTSTSQYLQFDQVTFYLETSISFNVVSYFYEFNYKHTEVKFLSLIVVQYLIL